MANRYAPIKTPLACLVVGLLGGWVAKGFLDEGRVTLGAVETERLVEGGVELLARVDTGASVSSLHWDAAAAEEVLSDAPMENVGRRLSIPVVGLDGVKRRLEATIVVHSLIRTAFATEPRYKVRLRVACGGVERETLVSLSDRSRMRQPFLLGRDFLEAGFVVDVSKNGADPF